MSSGLNCWIIVWNYTVVANVNSSDCKELDPKAGQD